MIRYWMSADLGQATDHTAITVLKRVVMPTGKTRNVLKHENVWPYRTVAEEEPELTYELHLTYCRALPLRTGYDRIAKGIVDRLHMLERTDAFGERGEVGLVLDALGPGLPVLNSIDKELAEGARPPGPYVSLWPVFTSGTAKSVTMSGRFMTAPKRDLVHALYIELQTKRLVIGEEAPGRETQGLVEEVENFRLRISERGHDSYDAAHGVHDDRVDSLMLGCWAWSYQPLPPYAPRPQQEIGV